MKNLNMYIPVRDETLFMIKYYQYLFNKYWSKDIDVYFLGYKIPDIKLDDNMHFVSLAEKRGIGAHNWSNKIIDFIESIDDEYFHFSMEDQLIIRPVDLDLISICQEMLNPSIGRIDMINSSQFASGRRGWVYLYKKHKGVNFLIQDQNPPSSVYRISCSNSIWNRKWFLKTLERNFSTTHWETLANDGRNNNDGFDVISPIDRWTPVLGHTLGSKWPNKINIYGMLKEDVNYLLSISSKEEKESFIDTSGYSTVVNLDGYQPAEGDISNVYG